MKLALHISRRFALFVAVGIVLAGALLTAFRVSRSSRSIVFEAAPHRIAAGDNPSIAVRDTGDIYLLKQESGNLFYEVSADGGDSFGHAVRVNDVEGEVVAHAEATPRLSLQGGRPYAVWQAHVGTNIDLMKLRFARSQDYGRSFTSAIDVDSSGRASQSFFNLSVSPNGTIYVVWLDRRDKGGEQGGAAIYLARSTDGGASFEKSVQVALSACPCCRPSLASTDDNTVHVGFRQIFPGSIRDTAVITSTDGGKSWGKPVRVALDNWHINGCPHSGPALAVLGRRLFVSWFTVHENEQHSYIFLAHSDNGGRSFSHREWLSESTVDPNHPSLIAAGDRVFATFQGRDRDRNSGWGKVRVYLREIKATGRLSRLISIPNLASSAYYPSLGFDSPDKVFVVWTEAGDSGNSNVVFARGRLAGAGM